MAKFLVVHDYGMGALWAYVMAPSAAAIRQQYPHLEVLEREPDWWDSRRMTVVVKTYALESLEVEWPIVRQGRNRQ